MPGMALDDPNNLLIQNNDATFSETGLSAGIASLDRARGAALADFDGDGLLDLAVVNRVAPLEVYRNTSQGTGTWVSIDARQKGTNTRAIGGWIELIDSRGTQYREITLGGGHAGDISAPQHFGLDDAKTVSFRVLWPNGTQSDWHEVDTDQRLRITRDNDSTVLQSY